MATNPPNLGGVIGVDNIAPIYNPQDRWQVWNKNEIYTGTVGAGKFVPKIHDMVVEVTGTSINNYIVTDINPTNMIATLNAVTASGITQELNPMDVIFGVALGTPVETYRVYIDKSVIPYTLNIDARNKVFSTQATYCKLFRGTDVSNTGIVISRMYDSNGNFLGENIPLETVADEINNNYAIKAAVPAYTNINLSDGEIVTAVVYNAAGGPVSFTRFLVLNTSFIRQADTSKKYITGINLQSPFMSSTNDRLLQYPINVPLQGLNLIGRVTYSDGSYREYPVDGTRFTIFGFEGYLATIVGQKLKLVLKYNLLPNETSYNLINSTDAFIAEEYDAITSNADGSYNLKLYGYPVWISDVSGYRLEWFMYNLDRNISYNVTPYVTINTELTPFNPISYGTLQRLNVSVNIRDVNGTYKNYIHAQIIDIVLNRRGSERINNWTVGFSPDQSPRYGFNTYATAYFITSNQWRIRLDSNAADFNDWLEKTYYKTLPIYDTDVESAPLVPNWFSLTVGNITTEYPIDQWADQLVINGTVSNNITVYVKFFIRINNNDLQLSIAGMPLYYVDNNNSII